jgi:hypothetical protein
MSEEMVFDMAHKPSKELLLKAVVGRFQAGSLRAGTVAYKNCQKAGKKVELSGSRFDRFSDVRIRKRASCDLLAGEEGKDVPVISLISCEWKLLNSTTLGRTSVDVLM